MPAPEESSSPPTLRQRGIMKGDTLYVNCDTVFAPKGTAVRVRSVGRVYVYFVFLEDNRESKPEFADVKTLRVPSMNWHIKRGDRGYCHHELLDTEKPA